MAHCPNCGTKIDPVRSKVYHREYYYCGTDEGGRISVACSIIRELQDKLKLLEGKSDDGPSYIGSWPDDEGV